MNSNSAKTREIQLSLKGTRIELIGIYRKINNVINKALPVLSHPNEWEHIIFEINKTKNIIEDIERLIHEKIV